MSVIIKLLKKQKEIIMNKKILLLLPALTLVLAGCNNQNKGKSTPSSDSGEVVGVESVTVTPNTLNLEAGQTATLAATVKPVSVENKDVVWSTNNPAAATVDASGKVTAVGEGTAVITATSDADESKKGTCTVSVTEPLFKPIKSPVLEKTFKFGTYQQNLAKRIFFNGEEEAYPRLHTTDVYDQAVDVYFENVPEKEGKYYVAFGEGTGKKYIGLSQNQGTDSKPSYRIGTVGPHSYSGTDFEITMADAEWDWDATNYTIKQTRGNESYFPGTYNDYDTISGCAYAKLADDFVFQFLTVSKPTILGNDYVIPGTATQLSVALPADVTDTPVWSIVEQETLGDVITINQSGTVTALASAVDGTEFTVKVVVGEYEITYAMKVTALDFGTLDDPITTEVAKYNIDVLATTGEMFVKGIVKKNTNFDKGYGTWQQVWLDGDTSETGFEGYKVIVSNDNQEWKYVFKNESSMLEMEVVIKGSGKLYKGTYEIENAELVKVSPYEHSSTIAIDPAEDFNMAQGGSKELKAVYEDGKKDGATWSIAPVGEATADKVTIDAFTGVVAVAADATVNHQYTVTAKLYSDPSVEASVTITVVAPEPLDNPITFSFADRTETGTYLDSLPNGETTTDFMIKASGNSSHVMSATAATVTSGNGSGGAYPNTAGLIKFGTGSKNGVLTIVLDATVNKVVLNAQAWSASEGSTLIVNSGTGQSPAVGAKGDLTFNLATASNVIEIKTSAKRAYLFSIAVSYVD